MEKMRSFFIVLCITLASLWAVSSVAVAMDQCAVEGNSYTVTIDGNDWTLSDFAEAGPYFSPAPQCAGTVNILGPDGQIFTVDWCVCHGILGIAGLPAFLSKEGLAVYALPSGLYTLRIGDTVYMTEHEIPQFFFK